MEMLARDAILEAFAMDAASNGIESGDKPKEGSLAAHDKVKRPDGFDPETDTCKFRDNLEKEMEASVDADEVDINKGVGVKKQETPKEAMVTPEEDAAYLEAVEKGDMDAAAKMVREAAAKAFPNTKVVDSDGKPKILYHCTDENNIKSFIVPWEGPIEWSGLPGLFFANKPLHEYGKNAIQVFANIKHPMDMNAGGGDYLHGRNEKQIDTFGKQYEKAIEEAPAEFEFKSDGALVISEKGLKKLANDGYYGNLQEGVVEYAVLSPTQVKSADPVTYYDDGSVVPLSKRFGGGDDIRFAIGKDEPFPYSGMDKGEEKKESPSAVVEGATGAWQDGAATGEGEKVKELSRLKERIEEAKSQGNEAEAERLGELLAFVEGEDAEAEREGSLGGMDSIARAAMEREGMDSISCAAEQYAMDEVLHKRGRGRPRKETKVNGEVCRADDPDKCWKHGYARKAALEVAKERARKIDKLNPQPTMSKRRWLDLNKELREVGWDIDDAPDSPLETENMEMDMENLRKEAKIRSLEEGTRGYANYKRAWERYEDLKRQSELMHGKAKGELDADHFDEVEGLLKVLKKRPKEIADGYREIVKAYEGVCDELCEVVEQQRAERGAKAGMMEVEKAGIGMLNSETGKEYEKRQRKLGNGKLIPETIKRIDEMVAKVEPRWRSVAGVGKAEFDLIKDNWRKTVKNLMVGSSLASNMQIEGLNGMLEEHLKSQHDLAKKGKRYEDGNDAHNAIIGGNEEMPRYRFTRKCFGTEKGMDERDYEKYGCIHTLSPTKGDNDTGGQYGHNVVRWKPYKAVATMTCTDSLCLANDGLNYVNPCLVTNPSPCCFNPEEKSMVDALKKGPLSMGLETMCHRFGTGYIELQLHGREHYNAEAVESISFGCEDDVRNLSQGALEKIRENGIPCYLLDEEIEIGEDGEVVRKGDDVGDLDEQKGERGLDGKVAVDRRSDNML